MFRSPIKEINAEFPAEEKYLDSIQRIAREACASAGMRRKDASAILLAIEEGATNIIRHAYLYEKGTLRLRITIYRKLIAFSLIDYGRSFKPAGGGQLDLDHLIESGRRGGLGFYMIQKIMDTVEYVSWAGQNELRMTRRLGAADPSGTPPLFRRMLSLRVKFSLWTFLIVISIIGGAFYLVHQRTNEEIYRYLDGVAKALGETIAEQSALYIINHRSDVEFDELVVSYHSSNDLLERIVLVDSTGIILAHSDDIRNIRKQYTPRDFEAIDDYGRPQRARVDNHEENFLALPILSGSRSLGAVYLNYSSEIVNERLRDSRQSILLLTLGLVLIGVIAIYALSNYFVRPIVNITRRVRRFTQGDLESELPLEGAAEFFEISSALNNMMTRLKHDRESVVERERLAKEIEVASEIQKTLLPKKLPDLPGLEIDAFYRAASVIGGDLYDVFEIAPGRSCLIVADVSGKGVPASLVMSMLRTVVKVYAEGAESAKGILVSANDYLTENIPPGMFVTVLMGIYSTTTRTLELVSAGHNPLLIYRADVRRIARINPSGMPLGVPAFSETGFADAVEQVELKLEDGDAFMLYTDGITEAVNREGEQYGMERLEEFLLEHWTDDSQDGISGLADKIVTEVDSFSGYSQQRDDMTFIIGRVQKLASTEEGDSNSEPEAVDSATIEDDESGSDS